MSSLRVAAVVRTSLLTETLTADETQEGAWVNVIGTIDGTAKGRRGIVEVFVQAVMMWTAGPLDIQRYEQALQEMHHLNSEAQSD